MLSLVIVWSYALVLGLAFGLALRRLLARVLAIKMESLPLTVVLAGGLVSVAWLGMLLNFFIKLGAGVQLGLLVIALALLYMLRADLAALHRATLTRLRGLHPLAWLLAFLIVLTTLIRATYYVANFDTGLYHAQAIRWAEEYPVVPGLANLHGRLGTNSSWFISAALLGSRWLSAALHPIPLFKGWADLLVPFHPVNSLLVLLFSAYCLGLVSDWLQEGFILDRGIALGTLYALGVFYFPDLASPHPDLAAAVLTWWAMLLWLAWHETGEEWDWRAAGAILLVFYAVTVKISTIPMLLAPLFILWLSRTKLSGRQVWAIIGMGGALALPWLARFVVLTGYPLYPLQEIAPFHFDWQVPAEQITMQRLYVTTWARIPIDSPYQIMAMPMTEWVPRWWGYRTDAERVLLLAVPLLVFANVVRNVWRFGKGRPANNYALTVFTTLAVGLLYWFIAAPDPRFGFGPLVLAALLGIFHPLREWIIPRPKIGLLLVGLVTFYLGMWAWNTNVDLIARADTSLVQHRWTAPSGYDRADVEKFDLNGIAVWVAVGDERCRNNKLPCMPVYLPYVSPRGDSLADGFRHAAP